MGSPSFRNLPPLFRNLLPVPGPTESARSDMTMSPTSAASVFSNAQHLYKRRVGFGERRERERERRREVAMALFNNRAADRGRSQVL